MEIRIQRLTLENFKCHRFLELNLEGQSATIYGANGAGKTSVREAFRWLLFGSGSAEVKPLNGLGQTADPRAVTAVEAVLTRDGEEITLRRCLRETRAVCRGSAEPVFQGNVCDYFVDGVPCRKGKYEEAVAKLVPEGLFRMLSDVCWFAEGMKWQERRAVLFDMAGGGPDGELIRGEPRFAALLPGLEKQTLEGYKAGLLREKRGYCHSREEFHARLDECGQLLEEQSRPPEWSTPPYTEDMDIRQWEQETLGCYLRLDGAVDERNRMLKRTQDRMEELKAREVRACWELNRIEELLYLAEAFTRYKAGKLEGSLNGLFRLATVRLTREQVNGGTEERCDILADGIPFPELNSAGKVRVGMDIISSLSRFYGVRLPLFIDNGESVSRLDGFEGQLIWLKVGEEDRKLRVELW